MRIKELISKLKELDENLEIGYYDASREEVTDIISIEKVTKLTKFEEDFESDLFFL
ncbi:hypothetical protein ABFP60_20805 [Clostridioides difficile]